MSKLWIKHNDNNEYNAKWPVVSQALQSFAGTDEVIIFLNDTKQQMSLGNIINADMAVPFLLKYFEQKNIAVTNKLTEVDLKDFLADYSVYVQNNPTLNSDADIQKLIEQGSVLMKKYDNKPERLFVCDLIVAYQAELNRKFKQKMSA